MRHGFMAAVIVDRNWGIGKDGDQLIYIKDDLKRFRQLTTCRPIIYGRKTLDTFPHKQPLPDRRNMILSTSLDHVDGAEIYRSLGELLKAAPENAVVIGGESVYKALLPYIDTVMVTKVDVSLPADRHFPNLDRRKGWKVCEQSKKLESDCVSFQYVTYRKI